MRNEGMNKQLNKETLRECGREYVRSNVKKPTRCNELTFFLFNTLYKNRQVFNIYACFEDQEEDFLLKQEACRPIKLALVLAVL